MHSCLPRSMSAWAEPRPERVPRRVENLRPRDGWNSLAPVPERWVQDRMASQPVANCGCGSNSSYRCCCERFDQTRPDLDTTEMALYLGWEDLWPCDPVSHHGLFAALSKLDGSTASE